MAGLAGSAREVRFRVLGPLEVTAGGLSLPVGGDKLRVLLAHLLLHANGSVSAAQLSEVLWAARAPKSAKANLQTYVWRLRTRLPEGPDEAELITHAGGHSIAVAPDLLDSYRFEALVEDATRARARGDARGALDSLERAEELWRGDPLEDLPPAPDWEPQLGRLHELRLTALEQRLAVQVSLGGHEQVVTQATALLVYHPYRERLWQQYMVALAHSGRRAEALHAYTRVRDRMIAELGVEPGPELRAVQATILRGEAPDARFAPPVELPADEQAGPDGEGDFPMHQLPPDLPDSTGRQDQVRELESTLRAQEPSAPPAVVVLSGTPGSGKSALVVHVAHRLRDRFTDGQPYVDLAGTGETARDPHEVLAEFLHALGVVGDALPAGLSARSAMFRSRLAARRVLLVLDDAAAAQQVRPLLPADGGCAVLVTSRSRLPELPGSRQWELDVLAPAEARMMLANIAGAERVCSDADEAAAVVRLCGHLPLAIRVAGVRLAGRRTWSLRTLRNRLVDESSRLGELRVGDLAVRSSFELSVRQLPDEAVRAFGLLSLPDCADFPAWVAESLFGGPGAPEMLDSLIDSHLVGAAGRGPGDEPRYRLHDLIRCYATEIVAGEPAQQRREALSRMLGTLLALARQAASRLPRVFGTLPSPTGEEEPESTVVSTSTDPLDWFVVERRTLLNAVCLAAENGLDDLAWRLAVTAVPFFDLRGRYDDWQRTHEIALTAVRAAANPAGEALLLRGLGQVHLYRGEFTDAERRMRESAEGHRRIGDRWGEAIAVAGLGTAARVRGHVMEALGHYRAALAGLDDSVDQCGQAQLSNSIGSAYVLLGEHARRRNGSTGRGNCPARWGIRTARRRSS